RRPVRRASNRARPDAASGAGRRPGARQDRRYGAVRRPRPGAGGLSRMADRGRRDEPAVTEALAAEHGLSADEYRRMLGIMGRTPTLTELGIFSVMWSEHCSYKSSKRWLRELPTTGPHVICGPGENAGVIDIGDGQAAIFKME